MAVANHSGSLVALAEKILADTKAYEESNKSDRGERLRLLKQVRALQLNLSVPKEAMFDTFTDFTRGINMRALLFMQVPEAIPRTGSISAKDIADKVGADESLIIRTMRVPVLTGIFKLTGVNEYAHTPYSLAYIDGNEVQFFNLMVDDIYTATTCLPDYFLEKGYHDVNDPGVNPYSWYNKKEGMSFYPLISTMPRRFKQFNVAMATQDVALPVLGMYPFGEELAQCQDLDTRPLLVDIGGGIGQSMLQIRGKWPDLKGKMILQDRPHVLDEAKLPDDMEKMAHDFFTEQPVKNAHAYYLRRCCHNWPDTQVAKIIQCIAPAMGPDSRLLIGEMLMPSDRPEDETDGDPTVYWMDHAMWTFAGKERTKKDFENLLDTAGLKLVKIWPAPTGPQTIIEAHKK